MKWQNIAKFGLFSTALALDCSADELKPFNFESIRGVYSSSIMSSTPPTTTNSTWYFGVCEGINQDVDLCPKDSDVCAISTIVVDSKDTSKNVVSEAFNFGPTAKTTYTVSTEENKESVNVKYDPIQWGDILVSANILFLCSEDTEPVILRSGEHDLEFTVKTKAACVTSKKDKEKQNKDGHDNDGESWGWFTWIFIFLVLFLSFYIIGGAWYQYNKGISIDFQTALIEVVQNFAELLKGLPAFAKEIVEKITGGGNRGEYSAV